MEENWKHTALLVIDMQNDFIKDEGLMRVNGGKAVVPHVVESVEVARRRCMLVVWIQSQTFIDSAEQEEKAKKGKGF